MKTLLEQLTGERYKIPTPALEPKAYIAQYNGKAFCSKCGSFLMSAHGELYCIWHGTLFFQTENTEQVQGQANYEAHQTHAIGVYTPK